VQQRGDPIGNVEMPHEVPLSPQQAKDDKSDARLKELQTEASDLEGLVAATRDACLEVLLLLLFFITLKPKVD